MESSYAYRTLTEAYALTNQLAQLCPDPDWVAIGLKELLINAIEHGCLDISYQEKSKLLEQGFDHWESEVERRLALKKNCDKQVRVQVSMDKEEIRFLITDPGPGFDATPYLQDDASRQGDLHGRGISLAARMSFHHLEFQGSGSTVLAVVRRNP